MVGVDVTISSAPQVEHQFPLSSDEQRAGADAAKLDEQPEQPVVRKKRIEWDDFAPPEPREVDTHEPEPEPSAPAEVPEPRAEEAPPQKVKLSLKDFALRKKKQREESKANASPVVPSATLGAPTTADSASSEEVAATSVQAEAAAETNPAAPAVVEESSHETVDHIADHIPGLHTTPTPMPVPEPLQEQRAPSSPPAAPDVSMDVDQSQALSFGAKVELVDVRIPSPPLQHIADTYRVPSPSPSNRPPVDYRPTLQVNSENVEPSPSTARSPPGPYTHQALARQISREDGEIYSPPPPKPTPLAPHAYSPPTRPRSFHLPSGGASLMHPLQPPPCRPLQPAHRSQVQNGALNARPLPSGPCAHLPSYWFPLKFGQLHGSMNIPM